MAKARVELVCQNCGQNFVSTSNCWNMKRAAEWEDWAKKAITLCPNCYSAAQEKASEDMQIAQAKRLSLPELIGTESQITWANKQRWERISDFNSYVKEFMDDIIRAEAQTGPTPVTVQNKILLENVKQYLYGITDAYWWIDSDNAFNRFEGLQKLINQMNLTVYPPNRTKTGIARIAIKEDCVCVKYQSEADFKEIMFRHSYSFRAQNHAWCKDADGLTPPVNDLAAEICADLFAAGYAVLYPSDEVKSMAEGGNFEREGLYIHAKKYKGFIIRCYGRNEEIYTAATSIIGSSNYGSTLLVPFEQWKALETFAKKYKYGYSVLARQLLNMQKKNS